MFALRVLGSSDPAVDAGCPPQCMTEVRRFSAFALQLPASATSILRKAKSTGAIAQLGERLLCKQEVVGSIPSGSTKSLHCKDERAEAIAFRQMRARLTQLLKLVKLRTTFTMLQVSYVFPSIVNRR